MKKRYQKCGQSALERFKQQARDPQESVQLVLPLAAVVGWGQQGVGELMRETVLRWMELVIEQEVVQLAGRKHQPDSARKAHRWGFEQGFTIIDGQKVRTRGPRVRDKLNREVSLGSYELFQSGSLLEESVWNKIVHGLTMRDYEQVVEQFSPAYGLKKSTISEHFVSASRKKLEQLLTRSLENVPLCAMFIDGTIFKGQNLVVAVGLGCDGNKRVLGLRQGATENATVVSALLGDLAERGVDFRIPRLSVLDGAKALAKAVRRHAGEAALVQRCQFHKRENVKNNLPEQYQGMTDYKMKRAYAMKHYADAKQALKQLLRELMDLNPDAARSLEEGLEETLTVHRLQVPDRLRKSLSMTNIIESTFSMVDRVCGNVKRWKGGDQRLRWLASGLLYAERRWNRVQGYRDIPALLQALHHTAQPNAKQAA